jgi:hypothetical protein
MSMNKKISFILGFVIALFFSGAGFYFTSIETARYDESMFMASYASEISTLAFVLNESDGIKREEIIRSELCEAITILNGSFDKRSFNLAYFEVVVSASVVDYQSQLKSLRAKHCASNI